MPTATLASFNPTPSIEGAATVDVSVARNFPADAGALGVPVASTGPVPRQVGMSTARR